MIKKLWPGIFALIAGTVFGLAVKDQLPARVASHWGTDGQVNGWSSRAFILYFVPALGIVMSCILAIAPTLDPKRRNFPMHADAYWLITNVVLVFLSAVHVLVIGYNMGWKVNFTLCIGVGLGALFVVLGNVLTRVRPNWVMGIRTPWTLSSDLSWRETHRVGGYAFVIVGLATIVTSLVAPTILHIVMLVGVTGTAVLSFAWSYFAWKRDPEAQGRKE